MKNEEEEMSRKRKNINYNDNFQVGSTKYTQLDEDESKIFLSLSFRPSSSRRLQQSFPPPSPQPYLQPQSPVSLQNLFTQQLPPSPLELSPSHSIFRAPIFKTANPLSPSPPQPPFVYGHIDGKKIDQSSGPSSRRARRNPTQAPKEGKSETIPVPFLWATNRRATVHSLNYLLSNQIHTITGEVQCKRCEKRYEIEYNVIEKFNEIGSFIVENKGAMHDRAPNVWMNPNLPACKLCEQENSAKPVISEKKKSINWLFLLLGQMLGCCTLDQLKYFCKHTKNHRTGAKDRVLYLTYLGLCKQLDPNGPFDR